MWNWTINIIQGIPDIERAKKEYIRRVLTIKYKLRNTDLLVKINSGEISYEDLEHMSQRDFIMSKIVDYNDYMREKYENTDIIPDSDEYKCGSCKSRKITWTQAQTRSADEPMTTFFKCHTCKKGWKS